MRHPLSALAIIIGTASCAAGAEPLIWQLPSTVADEPPAQWQTEQEAASRGCIMARLKASTPKSCVLPQETNARMLRLTIYDQELPKSAYKRSATLCLPSWHGRAKVAVSDVLRQGQDFLFVQFEGNAGTDTSQIVLAGLGWRDEAPKLVLLETLSYRLGSKREHQQLALDYAFSLKPQPRVRLRYTYRERARPRADVSAAWTDLLTWEPATFSFAEVGNRPANQVQAAVSRVRKSAMKVDLGRLCDQPRALFEATGIMDVLPPWTADARRDR